jgi:divalent metal cation (Fe/Co/Zn/Cd) transporter
VSTQAPALPVIQSGDRTRARLVRRAKLLSWLSLVWMTIEGAVGVMAGLVAGSVALTGFGLDSVIEGAASVIVIWRFTGGREFSEAAEHRAQRLVGVSFFLLAPYIAVDAILNLTNSSHATTSWVGVALAVGSIALMPLLGRAKARLGAELGSSATAGEGAQNMLCAYMAAGVLVGLLANALLGWWWLDPVIGLGIAALAVKEGREAWAGEVCGDCAPIGFQPKSSCSEDGSC